MLVKICGITRREDAVAAVEYGAGAVGFIMWPDSPRAIGPDRARDIVAALPIGVLAVGVFVNQSVEEVNALADRIGLTHVQLHGDEPAEYATRIERPVIRATSAFGPDAVQGWSADTTWLIDARDPIRRGGTGRTVDWVQAAEFARGRRVLLAGGLTPENVATAMDTVRPYGIDVSSGVESAPGIKDREQIKRLFEAVDRARASRPGRAGAAGTPGGEEAGRK
jgi:phosphoribosylanthranilate isomerase